MDTTYAKWGSHWYLLYRCAFPWEGDGNENDEDTFPSSKVKKECWDWSKMLALILLGHVRGPRDQNNLDSLLANPEEIVSMCFEF